MIEKKSRTIGETSSMKKLINKLEKRDDWFIQTIYLGKTFVNDYYIDFLKLIEQDKRINKKIVKNRKALISVVIRKLIKSYVRKEKERYSENYKQINNVENVEEEKINNMVEDKQWIKNIQK